MQVLCSFGCPHFGFAQGEGVGYEGGSEEKSEVNSGFYVSVSRIALVKPDKARGVEDLILRSAQMGQITEKV